MAQVTSLEKVLKKRKLAPSKFSDILKKIIHPMLLGLSKSKIGYEIVNCSENKIDFNTGRPILFAVNHGTSFDIPIALNIIKAHTYLLAGKQPLEKMDETFFNLNGTIYVDRKNKEDMGLSKEAMIEYLNSGQNILFFPEGTWNMTDSNPMLEMKWGIIDVAQRANALIVPIALDYDYDNRICRYNIGKSIDVNNISLSNGIEIVRNELATLKWKLFELKERLVRENVDLESERSKIFHSVEEYPKLDYDYEQSVVYHSVPTPDDVFRPNRRK